MDAKELLEWAQSTEQVLGISLKRALEIAAENEIKRPVDAVPGIVVRRPTKHFRITPTEADRVFRRPDWQEIVDGYVERCEGRFSRDNLIPEIKRRGTVIGSARRRFIVSSLSSYLRRKDNVRHIGGGIYERLRLAIGDR